MPSSESLALSSGGEKYAPSFSDDPVMRRRIIRKLDLTIVPVVTIFYLLSYLDRANIGNARVAGLQRELHLTDHQYQVAVTILFVPYILSELPANLILRRLGARRVMPSLVIIWGMIVTLQGLVSSYSGLLAVRFLIGLVEGPILPGTVLYLSGFYTRKDLSLRIGLFFSAASLASAFSGLLAAAIQQMDGVAGLGGWSWIFILEGLFSFLVGVLGFFALPSTPRDSKVLTQEEKQYIVQMLEKDRPSIVPSDRFSMREVWKAFISPHVIIIFIIIFMTGTCLYCVALFAPSIINQLGFSATKSQLLSVGPFALGFLFTLPLTYFSDKYKNRVVPLVFGASWAIVGWVMFLRAKSKYVAYASLFLSVAGVYAPAPVTMAWMANNSEPYFRRATSTALLFMSANCGGILATWRFPTNEGPRFTKTTVLNIVFSSLIVVGAMLNAVLLSWMNKTKKQNRDKILAPYVTEKNPDGGVEAWMDLGDRHPDFVYTI